MDADNCGFRLQAEGSGAAFVFRLKPEATLVFVFRQSSKPHRSAADGYPLPIATSEVNGSRGIDYPERAA